jgi:hypothetical protein
MPYNQSVYPKIINNQSTGDVNHKMDEPVALYLAGNIPCNLII